MEVSDAIKYSLRYTLAMTGQENLTRTIGSLNVGVGSGGNIGPYRNNGINALANNVINAFSQGTVIKGNWVSEQVVTF